MTVSVPAVPTSAGTLHYPAGSLVILTGLPGAGKTTLLRRLYGLDGTERAPVAAAGATVIDSAQSRGRWAGRLGWAPKPVRTGVVFVTHVWRIRRALRSGEAVIAHNRGCGPMVLRLFARLARGAGAPFHLMLLDATPEAALAGQRARNRVVGSRTFAYHRRRWEALAAGARAGLAAPAAGALLIDRTAAGLLTGIRFDAPPDGSPSIARSATAEPPGCGTATAPPPAPAVAGPRESASSAAARPEPAPADGAARAGGPPAKGPAEGAAEGPADEPPKRPAEGLAEGAPASPGPKVGQI